MSNEFQLVYPTCAFCEVCRPSVVIGVSSNGQFDFNEGWNVDNVWHEIQEHSAKIQDEYGKNYSCTEFIARIKGNQMHPSLQRQQELEEAERLLITICTAFDNETDNFGMYDVNGLPGWWARRKALLQPSEREKKLEKIRTAVRSFQLHEHQPEPIEEVILKALETE